MNKKIIDWYYC